MGVLVLVVVLFLALVLGAALAKGVLTLVLHLLVEGQTQIGDSIRAVAAGLFALVR